MIQVRAELGPGFIQLTVEGHENHAEQGRVCAAISAITQTALLGIEQVADQYPDHVSLTIEENP